ncbi:MAG: hypothetical protein K0R66_1517 [Gammaproteobacteria bacterium]|jgi:hypothetical protein|nr:hypothetical protein [Gammaproteobacteria bacterium]
MKTVILLAGPGGSAFNKENVLLAEKALQAQGATNLLTIGNGEEDISEDAMGQLFNHIGSSKDDITLVVMAHGEVDKSHSGKAIRGSHKHMLSDSKPISTIDFLKKIADKLNGKKIDIFTIACYGGDMHDFAHRILPKGSTYVAIAKPDEPATSAEVDRLWSRLASKEVAGCLSAESLLMAYTVRLSTRYTPTLSSTLSHYSLDEKFYARIGRPFNEKEKAMVLRALKPLADEKQILSTMDKISQSKNEWGIYAVDYGMALAISHASTGNMHSGCFPIPPVCNGIYPFFDSTSDTNNDQCPALPASRGMYLGEASTYSTPFAANMALAAVVGKLVKDGVNYLMDR